MLFHLSLHFIRLVYSKDTPQCAVCARRPGCCRSQKTITQHFSRWMPILWHGRRRKENIHISAYVHSKEGKDKQGSTKIRLLISALWGPKFAQQTRAHVGMRRQGNGKFNEGAPVKFYGRVAQQNIVPRTWKCVKIKVDIKSELEFFCQPLSALKFSN